MAKILELENLKDKYKITFEINKSEHENKFNVTDKYVIFSEEKINIKSKIIKRGKTQSSDYILIPKEIKNKLDLMNHNTECTINNIDNKTIIIKLN